MPPPYQKNSNITKDPPCGDLWSRYNCRKSSHKITMGKKIRSNHLKASRPFQGCTHYTSIFLKTVSITIAALRMSKIKVCTKKDYTLVLIRHLKLFLHCN